MADNPRGKGILAHSYQVAICGRPNCGPHIIGLDEKESPICEIVVSRDQTLPLIELLQDILYGKVVSSDNNGDHE